MNAMSIQKIVLFLLFIYFSFAYAPETHDTLDFEEEEESTLELVEAENLELKTEEADAKELINFIKVCVTEAIRGQVPPACYDSHFIETLVQKFRAFFGIKTNLKNLQLMIDESGQFCFSYDLARKEKTRNSNCLSTDEIIDKIFLWMFLDKQDFEDIRDKSDQQYLFGFLLLLLITASFFISTFSAMHYCQFKYHYIQADKVDNEISTWEVSHCTVKLYQTIQNLYIVLHLLISETINFYKNLASFSCGFQRSGADTKKKMLPNTTEMCKNVFNQLQQFFTHFYCHVKYHKRTAATANRISNALGFQTKNDNMKTILAKNFSSPRLSKCKKTNRKRKRLLRRPPIAPNHNVKTSSSETFVSASSKQSSNSWGVSDVESFCILSENDFHLTTNSLLQTSSEQIQNSSTNLQASDIMRENNRRKFNFKKIKKAKFFTLSSSESSYEIISINSEKKYKTTPKSRSSFESLFSSSSCSLSYCSEIDLGTFKSSSRPCKVVKKKIISRKHSQFAKLIPQKPPMSSDYEIPFAPFPGSSAQMNSNINQINNSWRNAEKHSSHCFSLAQTTDPFSNLKAVQGSKVDFVNSRIWSNSPAENCTNLDYMMEGKISSVSNIKKTFPLATQSALPTNQKTQLAMNGRNQSNEFPEPSEIDTSLSESSFNFYDSRWNSTKSTQGNNTLMKKVLTNEAFRPDPVNNQNGLVCGFSHLSNINKNLGSGVNREAETSFLGAMKNTGTTLSGIKNTNVKVRANNFADKKVGNPLEPLAKQEEILFDFSHLLNITENLEFDNKRKSNTCLPVSDNAQDPMSQFHADFSSANASFAPQPVIPAVDKCWDQNITLFTQQPNDVSISALLQAGNSPVSAFLPNTNASGFLQNANDGITFPWNNVLPKNNNSNAGVFSQPTQNKTFIPLGYSETIQKSKEVEGMERLLKMSKLQQDENYCIRIMLAKSTIKNKEYQSIFQDLTKAVASQAEAIYKKTQKKLLRAREDEMVRYNTIIDKYISEVMALQKKSKEVQGKVYKIRNDEKWKRFEIKC